MDTGFFLNVYLQVNTWFIFMARVPEESGMPLHITNFLPDSDYLVLVANLILCSKP